jgi:peptidoglycan/LPS O-acetylase OafA/YrhL
VAGETFGSVLQRHKGIGPGFDFARVALSFGVFGWHALLIAQGSYGALMDTPAWILNYAILPMFFGLSGFLVAGSAQRLSLGDFAISRGLRILPALLVEIALSALILGPMLTSLPLASYFSSPQFAAYFLNCFGWIHFELPGVFADNPYPVQINGSLWTVPFEVMCYLAIGTLIALGAVKRASVLVMSALGLLVVSLFLPALMHGIMDKAAADALAESYLHAGKGPAMVPCFLLGAAAYALRDRIAFDARIFLGCIAGLGVIAFAGSPEWWGFTPVAVLVSPMMIYVVCFVGLSRMPAIPFFSRGDYSYGIYLYGFPIQQALVHLFPGPNWFVLLLASGVLTTMFAVVSWTFIEKPALKLRRRMAKKPAAPTVAAQGLQPSSP